MVALELAVRHSVAVSLSGVTRDDQPAEEPNPSDYRVTSNRLTVMGNVMLMSAHCGPVRALEETAAEDYASVSCGGEAHQPTGGPMVDKPTSLEAKVDALERQLGELISRLDEETGSRGEPAAVQPAANPAFGTAESPLGHGASAGTFSLELPLFGPEQIEDARRLFRHAAAIGIDNLPATFQRELVVSQAIFAFSTKCSVWTAEWDRIIDEAEAIIDQGIHDAVNTIHSELTKVGFPAWIVDDLTTRSAFLYEVAESDLQNWLALVRLSGKIGLYMRCRSPF